MSQRVHDVLGRAERPATTAVPDVLALVVTTAAVLGAALVLALIAVLVQPMDAVGWGWWSHSSGESP